MISGGKGGRTTFEFTEFETMSGPMLLADDWIKRIRSYYQKNVIILSLSSIASSKHERKATQVYCEDGHYMSI